MTLVLATSIYTTNLVQIGQELPETICLFLYFPRWRPPSSWICYSSNLDHPRCPHWVLFPANDVMISLNLSEILRFWLKMPIPADFGGLTAKIMTSSFLLPKECSSHGTTRFDILRVKITSADSAVGLFKING